MTRRGLGQNSPVATPPDPEAGSGQTEPIREEELYFLKVKMSGGSTAI